MLSGCRHDRGRKQVIDAGEPGDALRRAHAAVLDTGRESIEQLCQSPNVDAVYVATPHELHAQHTLIALKNQKHVIVEKPMALTLKECEEMNSAADQYGVKLLCGHTKSFDPPIRKMREVISSGELGKL